MKAFPLLIKTEFFMDKVKNDPINLLNYVIDYADCATLILEQLGKYRYRKLQSCVLGQETPNELLKLISMYDSSFIFYCNKLCQGIGIKELVKVHAHPERYAVIIYDCFQ